MPDWLAGHCQVCEGMGAAREAAAARTGRDGGSGTAAGRLTAALLVYPLLLFTQAVRLAVPNSLCRVADGRHAVRRWAAAGRR